MNEVENLQWVAPEDREWFLRFKQEFEAKGYQITVINPAEADEFKRRQREQDWARLASGEATPQEIQRENSPFSDPSQLRIVDYGCLTEEPSAWWNEP